MNETTDHYLLRIFVGSSDKVNQQLLYEIGRASCRERV